MRTIDIYWDTERNVHTDEDGNSLTSRSVLPHITYKEKVLLRLRLIKLVDSVVTSVAFPSDVDTFSVAIDSDYDYDTDLYAKSTDDDINVPGDWEEAGNADPSAGQMSIRLSAFVSNFRTRLGTSAESSDTKLEIQGIATDDSVVAVYRLPFVVRNLIDGDDVFVPELDDEYGQKWVTASDGYKRLAHYFPTDNTWRYQLPLIVDDKPTYSWVAV